MFSVNPLGPDQAYVTFPLPPEISMSIAPSVTPSQETFEESCKVITSVEGSRIVFVIVSEQALSLERISEYIPPFTLIKSSVLETIFPKLSCHS